MPIITRRDGWTGIDEVIFVAPDFSGDFSLVYPDEYTLPEELDPLESKAVSNLFDFRESIEWADSVSLDYSNVDPCNVEQVLVLQDGVGFSRRRIWLNREGNGGFLGIRPQPQPRAHRYEVFTTRIADQEYRRVRDGGKVVGWESKNEYSDRLKGEKNNGIGFREITM